MASGLFADHGLRVDLVDPLGRGPDNLLGLADGGADLALGSVHYLLAARARLGRPVPARFLAVLHQRSPLAAFVPLDSPLRAPGDLGGRRVARSTAPWFDQEYRSGIADLGLPAPVHVGPDEMGNRPSLARGDVDIIGSWDEAVGVIRKRAGIPVRAIPFGPEVYSTGLLAADRLEPALAARVARAFCDALERQRLEPAAGVAELCARLPDVEPERVAEEWSVLSRYLFAPAPAGTMRGERWTATLRHAARTHGFAPVALAEVCRLELLADAALADSA